MEWNTTLEAVADRVAYGETAGGILGKSGGSLFSLECDPSAVRRVLEMLRQPMSVAALAAALGSSLEEVRPFVEALLGAGLVAAIRAEARRDPYMDSVILAGDELLVAELMRLLRLAGLEMPVSAPAAFRGEPGALLVGAPVGASERDLLAINDACLRTDTPWLPLYFDGAALRLGPTVLPYRTACFGCLLVRRESDHRLLNPDRPPRRAFSGLQEAWAVPESGYGCMNALRVLPHCVEEILRLAGRGAFPLLTGRQLAAGLDTPAAAEIPSLTVEPASRCPSCFCGTRARPRQAGPLLHAPPPLELGAATVRATDGGLRTVTPSAARAQIDQAFAPFGNAIRVERCQYGPLAELPSYRSFSAGYLDRRLPFVLPPKQHTGKGIAGDQAYLSAAYELAERLSAVFHGQQPIVQARPSEAGETAIDVAACLGRRVVSLGAYDRVEDDPVVDWVWGQSLISGRERLVPASMAFFPQARFRGLFKPQWSGGLSAGSTLPDAVLQGLLERVEHDGWAIWQLNRIACPRLDTATIDDPGIQAWLETVRQAGFEVLLRDRRTDLNIPTFRAWLLLRHVPQAFACRGDGAHLDKRIALMRALTEAQHKLAFTSPGEWEQVLQRSSSQLPAEERSLFYLSGLAPFELSQEGQLVDYRDIESGSVGDVAGDIATVAGRIARAEAASDVVAVNLTSPHLGIPVVRVVATGLQEMAKPWLFVLPRTFELPVRMGRRGRQLQYEEMYTGLFPH